jgi:hypothetical protein
LSQDWSKRRAQLAGDIEKAHEACPASGPVRQNYRLEEGRISGSS